MEDTRRVQQGYNQLINNYTLRADQYNDQLKKVSNKIIRLGWTRLLIFLLLISVPTYLYPLYNILAIIVLACFVIYFGILIKQSITLKKHKAELQHLESLNLNEIKALKGDWNNFDSGDEYINPQHDFSHDLDLFGHGSFFQYINRTSTIAGNKLLSYRLCNPFIDQQKIEEQQTILKELAQKLDFRQLFYAKGKSLNESSENLNKIKSFKAYNPVLLNKNKLFKALIIVSPWLFLISFILSFFNSPPSIPAFIFIFNITLIGSQLKTINKVNNQFSSLTGLLQKYAILTDTICNESFSSTEIINITNKLKSDSLNASKLINQLSTFMNHFDQRNGMIAGVLLNGFMLWDFKYVMKIEKWLKKYNENIFSWIDVVHEFDALNSMAGYVFNHPDFIFPKPNEELILKATEIGHPLINHEERICNNYNFKNSIFTLITGANMSGKSTFLRTIGINLIIARCGMTVCAKEMSFKPMSLITNMRTSDSLMKHESYFFAELKRLQYIIKQLIKGKDVFIILDEILKGTNSKDKTFGSMELIKHLLSLNAYGMIATHDLELGVLEVETKGKIINQCFEVENHQNKLRFDYKLHDGLTQNHNATFLMKQMGIIANQPLLY